VGARSRAAGNSDQERGERAGDYGWMMGRIHSSGQIVAASLSATPWWQVVGNTRMDVSEKEMRSVRRPGSRRRLPWLPPGGDGSARSGRVRYRNRMSRTASMLSVHNEVFHGERAQSRISVFQALL
jgi:hypothetical protein